MKIIAHPTTTKPCIIRPANPKRPWMDVAGNKNPYRCLPLSMANSWGWEVLSPAKFTAEWNGGQHPNDVKVTVYDGYMAPDGYFGEGTLTWHTGYVFRTPYPYGLYVTGIPNNPKPNAIPLSGVVETHWLAYTFTMNWRFTQPGKFSMDIGEPFCQIFPVDMNTFEDVDAEIISMEDDAEFRDRYWEWNISRQIFLKETEMGEHDATVWQRHYFQGVNPPDRSKCPIHMNKDGDEESNHRTKPNVPEFVNNVTSEFTAPPYVDERLTDIRDRERKYKEKIYGNQKLLAKDARKADMVKRMQEIKKIKEGKKDFRNIPVIRPVEPVEIDDTTEERLREIQNTLLREENERKPTA